MKRTALLFPSPLWGWVRGGGGKENRRASSPQPFLASPLPTLPHKRGGNTFHLPRRKFVSLLAAAVALPRVARAQLNAARPIRIIVTFAAAGSSDVLARLVQSPLQQALGQTVIVENRAGAGANIGMVEVARAERTAPRFFSPQARYW